MPSRLKTPLISLLRWSEKYTKTDMVYLASGGFWTTASSVVSLAIAAVTFWAFANLLPKENYGTYQYILSIVDLFGIFVLSGIDTAAGRSTAQGKDGSLMDGLYTKIRWGLIGGSGSLILGLYYLSHANPLLGWGFVMTGLFIPFWEAPGIYGTYIQGKKRFDLVGFSDVFVQTVVTLVLIPALFLTHNVLIILFLYLSSMGLARFALLRFSFKKLPPNTIRDPEMIPYGKHLSLISVINTIASNADVVFLWHMLGPAQVAVYRFSQSIPMRANGFFKIINRLSFPKMAAQESETLKRTLMPKILLLVSLSTIAAGAYALSAPYIFKFFLPQYIEAVPYTIFAALLIALQPFSLISSAFTAQGKKKSLYVWSIWVPLARIGLFLVLIPAFGLWGALIALIGAKVIECLLLILLFYRT